MQNSLTNTFLKGMNLDTAKEFVGTELYIDAQNVHIVTTDGGTSGAIQPYADLKTIESKISGTVLGTTVGHIHVDDGTDTGKKIECFIVLESEDALYTLNVYSLDLNYKFSENIWTIKTETFGFNSGERVKLVNVWENSEVSRVYMCGENSYIQVVNINQTYDESTQYDFSIFPKCGALPPFKFNSVVTGNKIAGKVQYAYQLFNKYGKTTALSAISHMIPIGSELNDDMTNEGISVRLDTIPLGYEYLRLFELRYTNFSDLPRVYIKDEFSIRNESSIIYDDTDDRYVSEYTLELFLAIKSAQFKSGTIAVKDNRLFAANITEDTWDIKFDARVYQADENGLTAYVKDGERVPLSSIVSSAVKVPEEYVYVPDTDVYKYNTCFGNIVNSDKYPYGGAGPNVSYMYIRPLLYLAPNAVTPNQYKNKKFHSDGGFRLITDDLTQQDLGNVESVKVLSDNLTDSGKPWVSVDLIEISNILHKLNNITYHDTYVCSNYTGFKQGEYYDFGIIFYNLYNIPSPVHPIGSIRIPYFLDWIFGGVLAKDGGHHDLLATTVGLRFMVNIDGHPDVCAYEIVRVIKTTDTRKVITQGIASNVFEYENTNGTLIRFPIYPSIGKYVPSMYQYLSDVTRVSLINDKISVISPEISTNKSNIEQSIKNISQINIINRLSSILRDTSEYNRNAELWQIAGGDETTHSVMYKFVRHMACRKKDAFISEGCPVGKRTDSFLNEYTYCGVSSRNLYSDGIGFGLFKYYISAPQDATLAQYNVKNVKFCGTIQTDSLGEGSTNTGIISGVDFVVNIASSFGKEQSNLREGIHCNCLYMTLSDGLLYDSSVINSQQMLKINMHLNWDESDLTVFTEADILDETRNGKGLTRTTVGANTFNNATTGYDFCSIYRDNTVALVDLCSNYKPDSRYLLNLQNAYISTGQYTVVNGPQNYSNCFGGDTYVCIHKEMWCGFGYDSQYTENKLNGKLSIHVKYPVETRINLDRVSGPNCDSDPGYEMFLFEPGYVGETVQELPLNAYNDAYSAQEYNKVFVSKGVYDIRNQHFGNRIMASEVKTTGELSDSFLDFKIANYIDVDAQYGNITNLVKYNDRLYYLQSTAFGTVAVNERSLITDNNQAALLLGTGDVLARYDNISTFYGSNVVNDPSVLVSPSSLYWYDSNKKSLCVFNEGGLNSLSKVKQVQSYFNSLNKDHVVHSGYDAKNNEVWFYPEGKSNSIIYSEQVQAFTGFYKVPVKFAQVTSEFSIGVNDNTFVQFGKTSGQKLADCYVKFVVNKEPAFPKVFDTIMVTYCGSITSDSVIPFDVDCTTARQGNSYGNCVHNREGIYYVSIGRDLNKERMRDKTMTVLLTFEDTNFNVPFVNTIYRYSRI